MKTHRFHLAFAAIALSAVAAGAQEAKRSEARWQAWYGCWSAVPADSADARAPQRLVCMTPTSNVDVVEVLAIAQGSVIHHDTIDASGIARRIEGDGCAGTQTGRWSADGRRVFLKSTTSCSGAFTTTTAMLAMTPFGEWLDIRSVSAAGNTGLNVARYRDARMPGAVPTEVLASIRQYGPNIDAARIASGVPISADAVIEASKIVDVGVLETWVTQTGLEFVTDATSLRQLAEAGIPAQVTDAMVTVVANSRDVYDRWAGVPFRRQAGDSWNQGTGQRVIFTAGSMDPWGYGFGLWRYGREYTRYAFGTNDWNWLYSGFGGYPWGFGARQNSVGYVYPPTIVLHNDPTGTAARGRASTADAAPEPVKDESLIDKAIRAMKGGSGPKAPSANGSGNAKPSPR